jgi:PPOX class probable F420-dependent enzyme
VHRRASIALTDDERRAYLAQATTIILVSVGGDGYPHAVPMWFVVGADACIYMTTYARSQKAVNLRRSPKVALLVESGARYEELKGVLIRGTAEVIDDVDLCVDVLTRIHSKHLGTAATDLGEVLRAQARKRAVLKITPSRVSSWDHRKLGGVY